MGAFANHVVTSPFHITSNYWVLLTYIDKFRVDLNKIELIANGMNGFNFVVVLTLVGSFAILHILEEIFQLLSFPFSSNWNTFHFSPIWNHTIIRIL